MGILSVLYPYCNIAFSLFLPQNMRYDELISLEREAVFLYSSVNETNAAFSSRIWKRAVPLPEKIDSPRLWFSFCQIARWYVIAKRKSLGAFSTSTPTALAGNRSFG